MAAQLVASRAVLSSTELVCLFVCKYVGTVERCNCDIQILGCREVYKSNSGIFNDFVYTVTPNCWFENFFPNPLWH
jgi:hypothetical protein